MHCKTPHIIHSKLFYRFFHHVPAHDIVEQGAHQFKFGFTTRSDLDGLDTLLARHLIVEPNECLVRLYALSILIDNLERQLERVGRSKLHWRGDLVCQGKPTWIRQCAVSRANANMTASVLWLKLTVQSAAGRRLQKRQ